MRAAVAVAFPQGHADVRVELAEGLDRDVEAREHAIGLDDEHPAGLPVPRYRRFARHVAAADVFLERAADDVAVLRGIEGLHVPQCRNAPMQECRNATMQSCTLFNA